MANKRPFRVQVTDLQLNADGSAALITRKGKDNPSPNGIYKLRQSQVNRLSQRALGFVNPIGLKSLIAMSFGSAFYKGEVETVKAGDTYIQKNADGTETEKVYEGSRNPANLGGAWEKTSGEELELGAVATAKVAELSITASMNQMAAMYAYGAPVAQRQVASVDPGTKQDNGATDDSGTDDPTTEDNGDEQTEP